jgi:hypothetical protein
MAALVAAAPQPLVQHLVRRILASGVTRTSSTRPRSAAPQLPATGHDGVDRQTSSKVSRLAEDVATYYLLAVGDVVLLVPDSLAVAVAHRLFYARTDFQLYLFDQHRAALPGRPAAVGVPRGIPPRDPGPA